MDVGIQQFCRLNASGNMFFFGSAALSERMGHAYFLGGQQYNCSAGDNAAPAG